MATNHELTMYALDIIARNALMREKQSYFCDALTEACEAAIRVSLESSDADTQGSVVLRTVAQGILDDDLEVDDPISFGNARDCAIDRMRTWRM